MGSYCTRISHPFLGGRQGWMQSSPGSQVSLSVLQAPGPVSSPAVPFGTADSCSWYKPNDHEHALQAHFLGNQADDMLMQIGRLELKLQKYICHLEGSKDKRLQGGPIVLGFHFCCDGTRKCSARRHGIQEGPVMALGF